jgi:hypothetical protein
MQNFLFCGSGWRAHADGAARNPRGGYRAPEWFHYTDFCRLRKPRFVKMR